MYPHGLVWTHREGTALKRNTYDENYSNYKIQVRGTVLDNTHTNSLYEYI